MNIAADTPAVKGENLTSPSDFVRDPRTCSVCAHWRAVASGRRGACESDLALTAAGTTELVPYATFGCRFWELTREQPVADEWKRLVIEQASRVVYASMVVRSAQSWLPNDPKSLDHATRLRVESVAVHLLNSLGFFRP